jgi:hypothetical protein
VARKAAKTVYAPFLAALGGLAIDLILNVINERFIAISGRPNVFTIEEPITPELPRQDP